MEDFFAAGGVGALLRELKPFCISIGHDGGPARRLASAWPVIRP